MKKLMNLSFENSIDSGASVVGYSVASDLDKTQDGRPQYDSIEEAYKNLKSGQLIFDHWSDGGVGVLQVAKYPKHSKQYQSRIK